MNKLKILTLFFASLFMLTLVSCSKDDDADLSKTELLTGGEWTGNKLIIFGNDVTEDFADYGYDVRKYKFDFKKDGTYTTKYDGTTEDTGEWEFANGEKEILLDEGTEDETTLTINKLTSSELYLKGETSMDDEGGSMTMDGEIQLKR